jgi:rhamnogalacturonyl hydrolase YesR
VPSIENTACVAQLARKQPDHPAIDAMLAFWKSREDATGTVVDGTLTAAEGNYSVSWPMALLAGILNRPELAEKAVAGLRQRQSRLVSDDGAIWLRYWEGENPPLSYRLWSRGLAWYMLGLAKTLDVLSDPPEDLIPELRRTVAYVLPLQRADGMWGVFADRPETPEESSGTAGIAAAMAIGGRRGWLGPEAHRAALDALAGLDAQLTPDGFLTGTSQSNKPEAGEDYQSRTRGGILQWGMGLYAQLLAEVAPPAA